jgi:hypothetical protein
MLGFHRNKQRWIYAGVYCTLHLGEVGMALGTIKVETLDIEQMPHDKRCDKEGCKEIPRFLVSKIGREYNLEDEIL